MENNVTKKIKNAEEIDERIPLPEEEGGYIATRLNGQMEYYHKTCVKFKKEYNRLSVLGIVSMALIPFFTLAVDDWSYFKYVISLLSVISAIITGVLALRKSNEHQTNFRHTYELLKTEKVYYLNSVGDYSGKTARQRAEVLISRCEMLMNNENQQWLKHSQMKGNDEHKEND